MAAFLAWLDQNWFNLLQSVGIMGSLFVATAALRRDKRSRDVSERLQLLEQHRELWQQVYERPELKRIKERNLEGLRQQPKFRFVEAQLQTVPLPDLLDGVTHIFHLAAQAGVRKSWGDDFRTYTSHNVDSTQRLLEAVKERKLHRFVYASSSSVYGDVAPIPMREDAYLQPLSPYGVTKLAADQLLYLYHVNHGVPAT